jgi:inhibitor of KinA
MPAEIVNPELTALATADFTLHPMGDGAWLLRLGLPDNVTSFKQIAPDLRNARLLLVRSFESFLLGQDVPSYIETVVGYDALLVVFEPEEISAANVKLWLQNALESWRQSGQIIVPEGKLHRIPVVYGGEHGLDFERVAATCGITGEELIRLHSGTVYDVQITGFAPGFAYLGNLPPELAKIPRLKQPRPRVHKGTVAIAAGLTAVYPADSPGGWNLLGSTPCKLVDFALDPPVRLLPGDRVQFYPVETIEEAESDPTCGDWHN